MLQDMQMRLTQSNSRLGGGRAGALGFGGLSLLA